MLKKILPSALFEGEGGVRIVILDRAKKIWQVFQWILRRINSKENLKKYIFISSEASVCKQSLSIKISCFKFVGIILHVSEEFKRKRGRIKDLRKHGKKFVPENSFRPPFFFEWEGRCSAPKCRVHLDGYQLVLVRHWLTFPNQVCKNLVKS